MLIGTQSEVHGLSFFEVIYLVDSATIPWGVREGLCMVKVATLVWCSHHIEDSVFHIHTTINTLPSTIQAISYNTKLYLPQHSALHTDWTPSLNWY